MNSNDCSTQEGKRVYTASGFKGKGFKFDETEAQMADDRKKLQKAALGIQDSDEEDAGLDIDQRIEEMFASRKRVCDVNQPLGMGTGATSASNQEKLELARKAASQISILKNIGGEPSDINQQAVASILKGGVSSTHISVSLLAVHQKEFCLYLLISRVELRHISKWLSFFQSMIFNICWPSFL